MIDYNTFYSFVLSLAEDILDTVTKEIERDKQLQPDKTTQTIRVDKEDAEEETEEDKDEDEETEEEEDKLLEDAKEDKVEKPKYDVKEIAERVLVIIKQFDNDSLDFQKDIGIIEIYEQLSQELINLGFSRVDYWRKMNCIERQDIDLFIKAKMKTFLEYFEMREETLELVKSVGIWPTFHWKVNKKGMRGKSLETSEERRERVEKQALEQKVKNKMTLQKKDIDEKRKLLERKIKMLNKQRKPAPVKSKKPITKRVSRLVCGGPGFDYRRWHKFVTLRKNLSP
uniref:Uncharacterized protein n=1 Tax=Cacopsylla melanoneura TaxID=428564 RepID=A0A8D8TF76_9HEMI